MFVPTEYGLTIFNQRYTLYDSETWEEACKRVAIFIASAEENNKIKKYQDLFYEELINNRFMPGGRIWYGSGRKKAGLINCFSASPVDDSREGWAKAVSDMIIISGMGGGCGMNLSKIRPRGEPIHGTGGEATGAVSLMELINDVGEVIKGGGGRRIALMECLNITHPDILEFLDKKFNNISKSPEKFKEHFLSFYPRHRSENDFIQSLDSLIKKDFDSIYAIAKANHDKILQNANVSAIIPYGKLDKFIEAIKSDGDWELEWREEVKKTVKAKWLWKKIIDNAYDSAEPGILNFDLAERMNNIGYLYEIDTTNPCGEALGERYFVCCLGHLVLPRFVKNGEFDWTQLAETISVAIRFLDDVLEVNNYPIIETKEQAQKTRRLGLGVLGLHDLLLILGYKYNSKSGLEFVDKLMNFIKKRSYESSIFLAVEKGPFPVYNFEGYSKSEFYKSLSIGLRAKIKEHGIRNCALNSIAPTGTVSIVCGTSSGIEPIFSFAYERRHYEGENLKITTVIHPLFKEFYEAKKDTKHFQSIDDLEIKDHLEMQSICQKHIDMGISKTICIPKGYPKKDLYDLLLKYLPQIKGITIYVEGSRGAAPLQSLSFEEAQKLLSCPMGKCEI